ncbi:MAG: response regulator [Patescibacteria group bacterium]|jgi:DNA-binding response OmpR family regulator|nr:response regulator [bacterium]HQC49728.1 response regulator [bacterium]
MAKKIFIIEDDASILYDLEAQFANTGYEIEVSEADEDDEELLRLMREFEPDYIVLDLILPKLEGFDLLKKIKLDPELRDKEVFIFTDLSNEDSRQRSLEMGADYVFFKEEFDTYQFAEKVIKIIKNQEKITGDEDHEEEVWNE